MLLANAFDKFNNIMKFAPAGTQYTEVQSFVNVFANTAVIIAAFLSIVAIAFGFVQIATSSGDPKNAERAQRAILWGAVGLVVSLLAWVLKNVLLNAAGISGVN
jgi:uncharacterized protein YacL